MASFDWIFPLALLLSSTALQAVLIAAFLIGAAAILGAAAWGIWQVGINAGTDSSGRRSLWVGGALGVIPMIGVGFIAGVIAGGNPAALLPMAIAGCLTIGFGLACGWCVSWVRTRVSKRN